MSFASSPHSPRTRVRSARMGFATAAIVAAGGATAFAADPRPDNARGAVVTIDPALVAVGGKVVFTGTGFTGKNGAGGEAVCLKIDDGNIANDGTFPAGRAPDFFGQFTSAADGTISGAVDLAKASADTPIAPGTHWIRFLSGPGTCVDAVQDVARSLHATFTVTAPPGATPTPTPVPPAPGATPAPTPAPVPDRVVGGTVVVTVTSLKLTKREQVELSLKAGAAGSAGKVRIVTRKKFKIGKAKKKQQVLFASDAYLVEPVTTEPVKLKLTAAGKTLFKTKTSIEAIVQIRDASGDSDVDQPVVVKR